jgi:hypothetical protein
MVLLRKGIFLSGTIHFMPTSVLPVLASALICDYRKTKKMMTLLAFLQLENHWRVADTDFWAHQFFEDLL